MKQEKTRKTIICISIAVLVAACMTTVLHLHRKEMVQELSGEVFRFHVLANSDSESDQALKMEVKEAILSYMKESLPESENVSETKAWALSHLPEICEQAVSVIADAGCEYNVKAEVVRDYFPEKTYGDVTFPEGEYEALRVEIGEGEGHNWWCVLYPNLCFTDAIHAVVPEEGKEELQGVLEEDVYDMITNPPKWKIGWFFF